MYQYKFPDFDGCTKVMYQNALICRKFTLKNLGVMRYQVANLLSNGSEKKFFLYLKETFL